MQGSSIHRPRGGLSVVAFILVLVVPLLAGWAVERLADGDARATETMVAPLRGTAPRPAAAVRLTGSKPATPVIESEKPSEAELATTVVAAPKR